MMIAIGCVLYTVIGGTFGAFLFSIGLLSVILFKFELFTGWAGKIIDEELKGMKLVEIWLGNLVGVIIIYSICIYSPQLEHIQQVCKEIMLSREQIGFFSNFVLAIPCGMLMYMAVNAPSENLPKLLYASMCVMAFILAGFYHCIADMFYTLLGAVNLHQHINIIFVTLGNLIGCNLIPIGKIVFSRD